MNRIILAYSPANADLAQQLHEKLSKSGFGPEHVASSSDWAETVFSRGLPVVMLVTDNLLTDRECMSGLLAELRKLPASNILIPVVADGKNAEGEVVPTAIDRMVNMLHYMNHWQNLWMKVSSDYQNMVGQDKAKLEKEMDSIRELANEMSEIITMLRAAEPFTLAQFEANGYSYLFRTLGLQQGQSHDLSHTTVVEQPAPVHPESGSIASEETAEAASSVTLPYSVIEGGIFTPVPVGIEPEAPVSAAETPVVNEEIFPTDIQTVPADEAVEQTIRDADFWIQQGFIENGLELLRTAMEFYPDNERISRAYEVGMQKLKEKQSLPPEPEQAPEPEQEEVTSPTQDAGSYWQQGLTAVAQGDYLYAKYCWDRVAEINPDYPGIYRNLGLMAAEHLADEYRETAVVYLRNALSNAPDDSEVIAALEKLTGQSLQPATDITSEPGEPVPGPENEPENEPVVVQNPDAPVVLITGATSGIGRATAEVFARNGYRLILNGRRKDRLDEIGQHLKITYGADVLLLPFDVRRYEDVETAFNVIPDHFRQIDVLINNAGLAKGLSPIHEGRLDHWETMIDTNIKGMLYVTRMVSPGMVERRKGHIVNISSSAGKEVYPNGNVYCATKFAVEALTKGFRADLYRYNVRVSQVSPGHVEETEFAITRFDGDAERARIYDDFRPLKSSDVADAIWFMVSRPDYVNIQDIQMFGTQQASSVLIDRSGR
ncbi:MAG: SDR family NAD(P)-dependent oxidoreductase [Bacteroidota bacterium]